MSSNGVILQHRAELITYLFVDRSDNLLIGNHIKKSLLDDRRLQLGKNRNLLRSGVNFWTDCGQGCSICHSDFSKSFLSFSPACHWACADDCHFKCFLAGYRSLVNSSRILQLIVTHPSSLRVRSTQVRDFLNSSCPTSPFNQVAVLTPLAGATQDSALSIHRPV